MLIRLLGISKSILGIIKLILLITLKILNTLIYSIRKVIMPISLKVG